MERAAEVRLAVLGPASVGKNSLVIRYTTVRIDRILTNKLFSKLIASIGALSAGPYASIER